MLVNTFRMKTALLTHNDCLHHIMPSNHPESVDRLKAIIDRLSKDDFKNLMRVEAPLGRLKDINLAHPEIHTKIIKELIPKDGSAKIDSDTFLSSGSLNAALRGVGAVTRAIDLVLKKTAKNAFCATRPPGHHAEKNTAMGFCLFGNVAIGAKYAIKSHHLDRVAIVDFDVHHGNGTQNILWDSSKTLFISSHQHPLFPGSGGKEERGKYNNIFNVPVPPYTDGTYFIKLLKSNILPKLHQFQPQLLIMSAGFDAHIDDPLANLNWTTSDYKEITQVLAEVAKQTCDGRIVSCLEGGYNLNALKESVATHVKALMEA